MRPLIPAIAVCLLAGLSLPVLADDAATASSTAPTEASAAPAPAANSAANDGVPDLPAGTVYLMARIKVNGTDLEQADFFTEKTITTLDDCDKQRTMGMTEGWQAYHHYLQTYKGMSYRVEYRCVVSDQRLSMYRYNQPPEYYYLVHTGNDNHMRLQRYRNFFACRDALSHHGEQESVLNFCARSAQSLVEN